MPAVLLAAVVTSEYPARPLHGEAQVMKQFAHMPRMVDDAELLFDRPGDHGRGPDSGVQPISHRPAVEDVAQAAVLRFLPPRRPPGPVTFQEALDAVTLIRSHPFENL